MEEKSISQKIEKDIADFKERYLKSLGIDTSKSSKRRNSTSSSRKASCSDVTADNGGSQLSNQKPSEAPHVSSLPLSHASACDYEAFGRQHVTRDGLRSRAGSMSSSMASNSDSKAHSGDTRTGERHHSLSACSPLVHNASPSSTSSPLSLQTSSTPPSISSSSPSSSSSSSSLYQHTTSRHHPIIKTHQELSTKSSISQMDRQKIKEEYIQSLRLSRRSSKEQNVFPNLKKRLTEFEKPGNSPPIAEPIEFVTRYTKSNKDPARSKDARVISEQYFVSKDAKVDPKVLQHRPTNSLACPEGECDKGKCDETSGTALKDTIIDNQKQLHLDKESGGTMSFESHSVPQSHGQASGDEKSSPHCSRGRGPDTSDILAKKRRQFRRIQSCDFSNVLKSLETQHNNEQDVSEDSKTRTSESHNAKGKILLRTQSFDDGQRIAKTFYEKITPAKHVIQLPGIEPLKSKVEKFNTREDKATKKMIYSDKEKGVISDAIRKAGSSILQKQEDRGREKRQSKIPLIQRDRISSMVSRFEIIKEKPASTSVKKKDTNTREEEISKLRKSSTVKRVSESISSRLTRSTLSEDNVALTQKVAKSEERPKLSSYLSQVKTPITDNLELDPNQNTQSPKSTSISNEWGNGGYKSGCVGVKNESKLEEDYLYYFHPTKNENTLAVGEIVKDQVLESTVMARGDDGTDRTVMPNYEWKLVFDEDEVAGDGKYLDTAAVEALQLQQSDGRVDSYSCENERTVGEKHCDRSVDTSIPLGGEKCCSVGKAGGDDVDDVFVSSIKEQNFEVNKNKKEHGDGDIYTQDAEGNSYDGLLNDTGLEIIDASGKGCGKDYLSCLPAITNAEPNVGGRGNSDLPAGRIQDSFMSRENDSFRSSDDERNIKDDDNGHCVKTGKHRAMYDMTESLRAVGNGCEIRLQEVDVVQSASSSVEGGANGTIRDESIDVESEMGEFGAEEELKFCSSDAGLEETNMANFPAEFNATKYVIRDQNQGVFEEGEDCSLIMNQSCCEVNKEREIEIEPRMDELTIVTETVTDDLNGETNIENKINDPITTDSVQGGGDERETSYLNDGEEIVVEKETARDITDGGDLIDDEIAREYQVFLCNESCAGPTATSCDYGRHMDEPSINIEKPEDYGDRKYIDEVWPGKGGECEGGGEGEEVCTKTNAKISFSERETIISDEIGLVNDPIFVERTEEDGFTLVERGNKSLPPNNIADYHASSNQRSEVVSCNETETLRNEMTELCQKVCESEEHNENDGIRENILSFSIPVEGAHSCFDGLEKDIEVDNSDLTESLLCTPRIEGAQHSCVLEKTHDISSQSSSHTDSSDRPSFPHFNHQSDKLRFESEVGDAGVMSPVLEGYENSARLPPTNHDRDGSTHSTLQITSDTTSGHCDRSPPTTPCGLPTVCIGRDEGPLESLPGLINTCPECEHSFINVTLNASNLDGRGERRNSTVVVGRCFFDVECCDGKLNNRTSEGDGDGQSFRDVTISGNVSDREFQFSEDSESEKLSFEENCVIVSHGDGTDSGEFSNKGDVFVDEGAVHDLHGTPFQSVVSKSVACDDPPAYENSGLEESRDELLERNRTLSFGDSQFSDNKLLQISDVLNEESFACLPEKENTSHCEDPTENDEDNRQGSCLKAFDNQRFQPSSDIPKPVDDEASLEFETLIPPPAPTEPLSINTASRENSLCPSEISEGAESFHSGLCESFDSFLSAEDSPQSFDRSPWCTDTSFNSSSKSTPLKASNELEGHDKGVVLLETYDYPSDWSKIAYNQDYSGNANASDAHKRSCEEAVNDQTCTSRETFSEAKERFELSTEDSLIYLETNVTKTGAPLSHERHNIADEAESKEVVRSEDPIKIRSKYKLRLPNSVGLFKSKLNTNWLSHLEDDPISRQDPDGTGELDCNANRRQPSTQSTLPSVEDHIFQSGSNDNTMTTLWQEFHHAKESPVEHMIGLDVQKTENLQTWSHLSSPSFDNNGNFYTVDSSHVTGFVDVEDKINRNKHPGHDLVKSMRMDMTEDVCHFVQESKLDLGMNMHDNGMHTRYESISTPTIPPLASLAKNAAGLLSGGVRRQSNNNIDNLVIDKPCAMLDEEVSDALKESSTYSTSTVARDGDTACQTKGINNLDDSVVEEIPKEPARLSAPSPILVRKGMYELKTFTVKVLEQKDLFVTPKTGEVDDKDTGIVGISRDDRCIEGKTKSENDNDEATEDEALNIKIASDSGDGIVTDGDDDGDDDVGNEKRNLVVCGDPEDRDKHVDNEDAANDHVDIDTHCAIKGENNDCEEKSTSKPADFVISVRNNIPVETKTVGCDDTDTDLQANEHDPVQKSCRDVDGDDEDCNSNDRYNDTGNNVDVTDGFVTNTDSDNSDYNRVVEASVDFNRDKGDGKYDAEDGANINELGSDVVKKEVSDLVDPDTLFECGLAPFDEEEYMDREVDDGLAEGGEGGDGMEEDDDDDCDGDKDGNVNNHYQDAGGEGGNDEEPNVEKQHRESFRTIEGEKGSEEGKRVSEEENGDGGFEMDGMEKEISEEEIEIRNEGDENHQLYSCSGTDDDGNDEFYMIQPDSLNSIAGYVDSPVGSSREDLSDGCSREWRTPVCYRQAMEYCGDLDDNDVYNDAIEEFDDEGDDEDDEDTWEEVVENIFNVDQASLLPELVLYPIEEEENDEDEEDNGEQNDEGDDESMGYGSVFENVLNDKREGGYESDRDVLRGIAVSLEEDTIVSACKKIVTWSDGFPDRRVDLNCNWEGNEESNDIDDSRVVRRVKIRESCIWSDFGVGDSTDYTEDDDYKRRSCSMEADSLDGYEEHEKFLDARNDTSLCTQSEHTESENPGTNSSHPVESHSSTLNPPSHNNSTQSSSPTQSPSSTSEVSDNANHQRLPPEHSTSEPATDSHTSCDHLHQDNKESQPHSSPEDSATQSNTVTNESHSHPSLLTTSSPPLFQSESSPSQNHNEESFLKSESDSTNKSFSEHGHCQKKVRLNLQILTEDSDNNEESEVDDDSESQSSQSLSDSSSFEGRIDNLASPRSPYSPSGFNAFCFPEDSGDEFVSSTTRNSNMATRMESSNVLMNGDAASASQNSLGNNAVNPLRLNSAKDGDLGKTEEEETEVDVFLESPNSGLHRINSENVFQPNNSMDNTMKSEDLYKKLERSQSDASLLKTDMERSDEETEVHLTAAEHSSTQNISECNRVYLDLSKAEVFEKVELGESGSAMMRTSSGRLLETIPQDEELKTGDLSYIYASHRSFSTESSSSLEDLNSYGKTKTKDLGANKYKNSGKAITDGGNTNMASKSNLRSSFQIYSHSLKQKVRQLQMGSLPEQVNALKELNVLMDQAWSMPVYGKDLAYELCDILRTESALDIIVGNVASSNRELMKVSARLLEQSLTTYNRRQVAETGLEMVVKMTHDSIGDCELAQICTGILESLFKTSEETCSRVIKLGGLDVITFWCRCNDRVTLKNCAIALSNLALYGGRENQQEMTKHKVPEWLFPLAFVEDDSVRYYALLAIGILVSNKEIENDVVSSGTLALVLPFVDSHDPAEFAQRDTSHRHGRSPGWLKRLIPVLSSKREEAQSLAAFHFVMEAGIKSEQDRKEVLYKIGAVEPLKWLASTPNRVASRLAGQALRIIGEEIPHKLSQQVPLWTIDDVVHWIAQVGFSGFTDVFQACQIDGDLLLRLSEDDLKESLEMPCAVTRKRFQRELRDLKMSADYTSCDPSMLGSWLRNVSEDMAQYTYQMLHAGLDRPLLRSVTNQHLMQDCGVTNGIHRMKIMTKIDEFRSNPSSPTAPTLDKVEAPTKPRRNSKAPIDVFISYRRSNGSQLASLLKVHLQLRGFTVFIDIERLRAGKFDENLLESVKQAKNFIIVLTQNSLDRCMGDDTKKDWVHREITAAMEAGINIIPLMDNFRWPTPDSLPEDMRNLSYFNGIRWIHDYQDACVDKLESFIRGESSFNREPTPVNNNFGSDGNRTLPLIKDNIDVDFKEGAFSSSSAPLTSDAPFPSKNTKGSFQSASSPPYQRAQGLHKDVSIDIDSPPES